MFWTKEINDKVAQYTFVALAIDLNMNIDNHLYAYDGIDHTYRVSYNKESSNQLHLLLKFKIQKRFVVIEKDDDMISIVGHYDEMINEHKNRVIVDLQKTQFVG